MARIHAQSLWDSSIIGRLVRYAFAVWDHSQVGRAAAVIGRFSGRVFAGSLFGRVWYSQWPGPADASGSRAGFIIGRLGDRFDRLGSRMAPLVAGLWETSLLAGLGRRTAAAAAPYLETSQLFQAVTGYQADLPMPQDSVPTRRTSPVVYLLGVLLGWLPLIPADARVLGLSLPSPTMLMIAGVWGAALLWLTRKWLLGDRSWRASSALLPLALFLLVAAAATVQSVSLAASLPNLVIWLTASLLFWLIVNLVRNSRDAAALLGPILVGACLMTVWAVYQVFFPPVIEEKWVDPTTSGNLVRVFASLGNPNYLAEYLALYLPLALALWVQNTRRRLEMAVPVVLIALGLVLTYSRGGWLAAVAALGLLLLMRGGRWTLFLALAAVALALVAPQSVVTRIGSVVGDLGRLLEAFATGQQVALLDTSNAYRLNLWIGVKDMLAKFWILGAGLGAEAFSKVYQEFMLPEARAAHAHNTYLQMLAETGILGLTAILWALLAVIRRPFVAGVNPHSALLIAAVPAALTGMLVHGLVEHIWYNPKLLFAFWAVAGLGMGLALGEREDAPA